MNHLLVEIKLMQLELGKIWKLSSKITVCLENEHTLPKLHMYRGTQKNNNTVLSKKKGILKSVSAWYYR